MLVLSKTELEINLPAIKEEELEKWEVYVSAGSLKELQPSPAEFILFSAISANPLQLLERQMELTPDKIISLFIKEESANKFLLAMMESAVRFQDKI